MDLQNFPTVSVDMTVTISVILGCAAVISPILVAIINNHHQYRLKKLEYRQKEREKSIKYKRRIYEDFLCSFNRVCQIPTKENLSDYSKSYPLAYIYLPDYIQKDLNSFNLLVHKHLWADAINYVEPISQCVYKELQKL